jgi:hypothetical protein
MPHSPKWGGILVAFSLKKAYRMGRTGDLGAGGVLELFKKSSVQGFPIAANHADRIVDLLSPLPCQAWHAATGFPPPTTGR